MVFRMPASARVTDILNRSVRISSADPRIRGDDRHYWQIRMLIVHNQGNKMVRVIEDEYPSFGVILPQNVF